MNKIVLEHYPVSRLPDDLREAIGGAKEVTLTIVTEDAARDDAAPSTGRDDWFSRHEHIRRDTFKTTEEVTDYVRSLRDEWSHRER
jgi:hypothetical protein